MKRLGSHNLRGGRVFLALSLGTCGHAHSDTGLSFAQTPTTSLRPHLMQIVCIWAAGLLQFPTNHGGTAATGFLQHTLQSTFLLPFGTTVWPWHINAGPTSSTHSARRTLQISGHVFPPHRGEFWGPGERVLHGARALRVCLCSPLFPGRRGSRRWGGKAKPALKLLRSPRRFLERILGG